MSSWLLFTPVHYCSFSLSLFLPDGQSRGRKREKEWVISSRASSSRWVACVQSCLWTACHNNAKLKAPHILYKRCTFERLMKLLLQPPTNHLVLWFCSDAFYKHRPGEHGEQVSHILNGSCRRFNTRAEVLARRETLYLCLRNVPDRFSLFSCQ